MENVIDLKKFNEKRTLIKEIFSMAEGTEVELAGWVYDTRALGQIRFLMLNDSSGRIQLVGLKKKVDEESFKLLDSVSRESVIYVKGIVKYSNQALGGMEVIPSEIKLIAKADDLPIDVTDRSKTELSKRLDYRFLDLHRKQTQAIFKIQSTIMQAYRKFMVEEVNSPELVFPSIIGSSSEGGTETFKLKYFEKEAFLSQSCQLYKQMVACSMEKAFTIFTVWRAEKHSTVKHLNEARQLDFEMAFADEFVVMDILAKSIQYMIKEVLEKNKEELEVLEIKDLVVPTVKYLTFKEAYDLLVAEGIHLEEHDLNTEAEKKLGELYPDVLLMIHDWPYKGRGFYILPKDEMTGTTRGFDCIYRGMEITSGGQRVHVPEILEKQLVDKGLDPKDFKDYIDSFKFGAPPHGGFGLGLERLTMLILNISNIREVTLFPRDRERLTP